MNSLQPSASVLGEMVPTSELALHEAEDLDTLHASLAPVMDSHMPGFIIRGSTVDDLDNPYGKLPYLVVERLRSLGYMLNYTEKGRHSTGIMARSQGLGVLHRDGMGDEEYFDGHVHLLNVHETVSGSGDVVLIETGARRVSPEKIGSDEETELAQALLSNRTDPTLLSPRLHVGWLSAGDFLIFALDNANGPVWHRFDTDSERRRAQASVYKHEPAATPHRLVRRALRRMPGRQL